MARAPYIDDPDFRLLVGDAAEVLAELEPGTVDCCVTSPPYWNLRDYGADGQLGLEATPEQFVAALVAVFAQVRRVLAEHGTVWLNLGDSYNAYNGNRGDTGSTLEGRRQHTVGRPRVPGGSGLTAPGLKQKDMVGIPWRVAFALQVDGWWLRSDIIWHKTNPMPASVRDRPTTSHEYVFLLSKRASYYFDQEAVREPHSPDGRRQTAIAGANPGVTGHDNHANREGHERWPNSGRNVRSVWEIPTQPFHGAHFATFPRELALRCIRAGCPERVCRVCGKPAERIVEASYSGHRGQPIDDDRRDLGVASISGGVRAERQAETVGWTDCGHGDWRTGIVLDPFIGSGTTALAARALNRHAVGIELSPESAVICRDRTSQLPLEVA